MSVTTNRSLMANLILVRLLAPSKSISKSVVKTWLRTLFPSWNEEAFGETIRQLIADNDLAERPLRLTETGRQSALEFLNVESLSPGCKWATIKDNYLIAKSLDRPPGGKSLDAKKLAAHLIATKTKLPSRPASLTATVEAYVCHELGYPELTSLQQLRDAVVRKVVTFTGSPKSDDLGLLLAQKLGGVHGRSIAAMRESLLQKWVQREAAPASPLSPPHLAPAVDAETNAPGEAIDLEEFARTVQAAAKRHPHGWFGENKIFIHQAWQAVKDEPLFARFDLPRFKELLLDAHRQNYLSLSRADLVEALSPSDVRDSEIDFLNATFHFLLIRNETR